MVRLVSYVVAEDGNVVYSAPQFLGQFFMSFFVGINNFSNLLLLNRGKSARKKVVTRLLQQLESYSISQKSPLKWHRAPPIVINHFNQTTVLFVIFIPVGFLMFANKALLPSGELRQAILQVALPLCKSPAAIFFFWGGGGMARSNESSKRKNYVPH